MFASDLDFMVEGLNVRHSTSRRFVRLLRGLDRAIVTFTRLLQSQSARPAQVETAFAAQHTAIEALKVYTENCARCPWYSTCKEAYGRIAEYTYGDQFAVGDRNWEWSQTQVEEGLSQLQIAAAFGVRGRPASHREIAEAKFVYNTIDTSLDIILSEIKAIKAEIAEESGLQTKVIDGLGVDDAQALSPIEVNIACETLAETTELLQWEMKSTKDDLMKQIIDGIMDGTVDGEALAATLDTTGAQRLLSKLIESELRKIKGALRREETDLLRTVQAERNRKDAKIIAAYADVKCELPAYTVLDSTTEGSTLKLSPVVHGLGQMVQDAVKLNRTLSVEAEEALDKLKAAVAPMLGLPAPCVGLLFKECKDDEGENKAVLIVDKRLIVDKHSAPAREQRHFVVSAAFPQPDRVYQLNLTTVVDTVMCIDQNLPRVFSDLKKMKCF